MGRVKLDFDPALNIGRVSFSNPNPTLDPKKPDEMRVEGTRAGTDQWAGPGLVHTYKNGPRENISACLDTPNQVRV